MISLDFRHGVLGAGRTLAVQQDVTDDGVVLAERVVTAWHGRDLAGLRDAILVHRQLHHLMVDRWFKRADLFRRARLELARAGAMDQATVDGVAARMAEAQRWSDASYRRREQLWQACDGLGLPNAGDWARPAMFVTPTAHETPRWSARRPSVRPGWRRRGRDLSGRGSPTRTWWCGRFAWPAHRSSARFNVGLVLGFTVAALGVVVGVKWWIEQWPTDPPIRR